MRAKIVLRCAEGGTNKQAAADLGIDESMVERWRVQFIARRCEGLHDEPRPGRPSSILLDQVEDVIVATLETTPGKDTHWSRSSMAARTGLSKSTIGRIWRKFDLRPHLQDSFKLSTGPAWLTPKRTSAMMRGWSAPGCSRCGRKGRFTVTSRARLLGQFLTAGWCGTSGRASVRSDMHTGSVARRFAAARPDA